MLYILSQKLAWSPVSGGDQWLLAWETHQSPGAASRPAFESIERLRSI